MFFLVIVTGHGDDRNDNCYPVRPRVVTTLVADYGILFRGRREEGSVGNFLQNVKKFLCHRGLGEGDFL